MRYILTSIFILTTMCGNAQYYMHGEVRNEYNELITFAKIFLSSKNNLPYSSGSMGVFGIPVSVKKDTITIIHDGYDTCRVVIDADKYQILNIKKCTTVESRTIKKLVSINKNEMEMNDVISFHYGETYNVLIENSWVKTLSFPKSEISLNTDNASYSNIRRFVNQQSVVPVDAVRIEEMLNYFSLGANKENADNKKFLFKTYATQAPWDKNNLLLFINMQAPKLNLTNTVPCNLVFLIDVSGSMDRPERLPLIQSALKLLVTNLRDEDTIAIVTYGGNVGTALTPISGSEKDSINKVIEQFTAGGDTPGEAALQMAYNIAGKMFNPNSNNRIIIATDGDFNAGQTGEEELGKIIAGYSQLGIYLTCVGVGMGNYKNSKLESLARKGHGNFAYVDNNNEAEKIFIKEFTKTMYSVADDAFIQVQFNPAIVKEYRLIGYDNRRDALKNDEKQLEGGEIGSGHSIIAAYEVVPAASYIDIKEAVIKPINSLTLQYKQPFTNSVTIQKYNSLSPYYSIENCDSLYRFAASVITFGELLKNSLYTKNYTLNELIQLANTAVDKNEFKQKEFMSLLLKAKKIYPKKVKYSLKIPGIF